MPSRDEDVIVGDGEKKNVEGEGKDESVFSDVSSHCSEIAAIAEYDVIDFCIKTPHSTHTHTNPLRGAGRGDRRGPLDTRRHKNRDRDWDTDRDRDKDRKKRGKMNVGFERTEKRRNEDRDKEIGRGRKSQGEGEEEEAGRSDYSVSESFESRSLSLSGLDKPLYLHSSPLLALCSADHVRHHTDFR